MGVQPMFTAPLPSTKLRYMPILFTYVDIMGLEPMTSSRLMLSAKNCPFEFYLYLLHNFCISMNKSEHLL